MTTEPEAEATAASASRITGPLREIGALVLLGANALMLFVGVLDLLFSRYHSEYFQNTFTERAFTSFYSFVGVAPIALPFVAFLLATHGRPPVSAARLITLTALIQYGVSAFFGVIFGVLVGLVHELGVAQGGVRIALEELLQRTGWLAVLGIAAFAVLRVLLGTSPRPKPPAQPGLYGQPTGYPQAHAEPQGYPRAHAEPQGYPRAHAEPQGYPQAHAEQPGYPRAYAQPAWQVPGAPQVAPPVDPPTRQPSAAPSYASPPIPPPPAYGNRSEDGPRTVIVRPEDGHPTAMLRHPHAPGGADEETRRWS